MTVLEVVVHCRLPSSHDGAHFPRLEARHRPPPAAGESADATAAASKSVRARRARLRTRADPHPPAPAPQFVSAAHAPPKVRLRRAACPSPAPAARPRPRRLHRRPPRRHACDGDGRRAPGTRGPDSGARRFGDDHRDFTGEGTGEVYLLRPGERQRSPRSARWRTSTPRRRASPAEVATGAYRSSDEGGGQETASLELTVG